jgi:hypothetical protein
MASQPFRGAEARENNQRHENNFYRRGIGKRSKEKDIFKLFIRSSIGLLKNIRTLLCLFLKYLLNLRGK